MRKVPSVCRPSWTLWTADPVSVRSLPLSQVLFLRVWHRQPILKAITMIDGGIITRWHSWLRFTLVKTLESAGLIVPFWRPDSWENSVCGTFPFLQAPASEANGCFIMTVTHLSDSWMLDKNKLRLKGFCWIDPMSHSCIHLPMLDRL